MGARPPLDVQVTCYTGMLVSTWHCIAGGGVRDRAGLQSGGRGAEERDGRGAAPGTPRREQPSHVSSVT